VGWATIDDLIVGTATPEPTTLAIAGLGGLGLLAHFRRTRSRKRRVPDAPAA
jgi:hypothetical protein